jgi:hypothetical protein
VQVQQTLQTATVEAHDDVVTHDHHRCRLLSRGSAQGVERRWVFGNVTIRKGNTMIGKKLFHVMA